jgi:26S proteasome regulatory subunit N7
MNAIYHAFIFQRDTFINFLSFTCRELSRFIAAGKLHCKIDKVAGVLETNRPDARNAFYQATIKQGDFLLNRIQKLSRVIDL